MERMLDTFIAVAVVFLVLSLVVKAVQDILKHLFKIKERKVSAALQGFVGSDVAQDIVTSLDKIFGVGEGKILRSVRSVAGQGKTLNMARAVFGKSKAEVLEDLSPEEFRGLLNQVPEQNIKALPDAMGLIQVEPAKDRAVQLYTKFCKDCQKSYEKSTGVWVFTISFLMVFVLNANIVPIYDEIATNAATRQALVAVAEEKYKDALESVDEEEPPAKFQETLQKKREEIKKAVADAPIIMRGALGAGVYISDDAATYGWPKSVAGLLLSTFLVYLGAPFWHDLLQTLLSAKNLLKR